MPTSDQPNRTKKLVEIVNIINSTLEIDDLLNLVIETVSSAFDAEGCSLVLRQPGTDELYFRTAAGLASVGRLGRYISIDSGPNADNVPSNTISAPPVAAAVVPGPG